ncbi:hypothetical protein P7C73_g2192, partial [Tremellales sp. Uapishka_1]
MAKTKTRSIGIVPAAGKKITFGDDDASDYASTSKAFVVSHEEDANSGSDSDDAPEAFGLGEVRSMEKREVEKAELLKREKREAARTRARKIQEVKKAHQVEKRNLPNAPGSKKRKVVEVASESEGESASGSALDDGEEEGGTRSESGEDEGSFHTISGSEEDEEEEEDGEEDRQSFHTESEAGAESDDDSERLEDGPIDDETRRLRARMQAAMEAAERGAAGSDSEDEDQEATPLKKKSALKPSRAINKPRAAVSEDAEFDMEPLHIVGKPLPASVLRKAAELEEARKSRERVEKARLAVLGSGVSTKAQKRSQKSAKRRKGAEGQVERKVSDHTTLHLLEPTLGLQNGQLPPVLDARKRPARGQDARTKFMKGAMKLSGKIPGRGLVDGRR